MADNDVRGHEREIKTLRIHIELELVMDQADSHAMLTNLGDELATLLTLRLESTHGVLHLRTPEWDVSLQ